MNEIIFPLTSSIVAIVAILSPLFVKILENKHDMKARRWELLYKQKQSLYLEFGKAYSNLFINESYPDALNVFETVIHQVSLICDIDVSKDMQTLLKNVKKDRHNANESYLICENKLRIDLRNFKFGKRS